MISRRDFLGLMAGALAAAVVPLPKPEEPMGLLGLVDDGTYVNCYFPVQREVWMSHATRRSYLSLLVAERELLRPSFVPVLRDPDAPHGVWYAT